MLKAIISIANPAVSGTTDFIVETPNVPGAPDSWVEDLADWIKDNPPATLGWVDPSTVQGILVYDEARGL